MLNYYGSITGILLPKRKEDKRKEEKGREEKRIRIKDIYNQNCSNLPQIKKLTDKRNTAIDNFIKEFTEEQFIEVCKIANCSDFLTGNNDRGWKADFDFLLRIDKATSILEGKYSNTKGGINDFKKLWEEAKKEDEQSRNSTNNNSSGWQL